MHYCVGDIHGCYDEMMTLIKKIEAKDPRAEFYFVGDFPDRGPKVWETMNWVAEMINPTGRFRAVRGNHDYLLMEWYYKWVDWYGKQPFMARLTGNMDRTDEPRTDYDFYDTAKAHKALKPSKLNKYIATFSALPHHIPIHIKGADGQDITFDIVHGWYAYDFPANSMGQKMFNMWARECEGNHVNDHIIVHGHTPTITSSYTYDPDTPPGMIVYRKNAINLDGGCCYYGPDSEAPCMLCAICLETLEEFYSHTLEQRLGTERAAAFRERYYSKPDPYRQEMLGRLGVAT